MRRSRSLAVSITLALCTLASAPARGDEPPDPTARRHLGFALRLTEGIGYSHTFVGSGGSIVGPANGLDVVAGWAVQEDLLVGAHLWMSMDWMASYGGSATALEKPGYNHGFLRGVGVNATWWLTPANVYLSASPSLVWLSLDSDDGAVHHDGASAYGPGLQLAVGKAWWLTRRWGLGAAVQVLAATMPVDGQPWLTTLGAGLAPSATYD